MIQKNKNNSTKPADRKATDRVERKAANGQGITYGAREAGRAPEHFEAKHGKHATNSSTKAMNGKPAGKKSKEQRIVSG